VAAPKNPEDLDLSARSTIAYQPRFNPIPLALADYLNEALRQIPVQFEWPLLVPYYFSISTCAINLPKQNLLKKSKWLRI
jgi:hypothetical protein